MNRSDLLTWFDEIATTTVQTMYSGSALHEDATKWITEARSAIAAAFPPGHQIHREWDGALRAGEGQNVPSRANGAIWHAVRGVFASAHSQLRAGRIESFIDGIRAEAEDELLVQAEGFLDGSFRVAAAVLGGGALEVHLRRLCEKNQVPIEGHGSIDKYNTAIAQARKSSRAIYEKADQSQITGWGQIRNEAAHQPDQFKRTAEELRLMIEGIRNFIARIS